MIFVSFSKMARWYFLVSFICTSCIVAGQFPKYALKGHPVLLKPDISGHPDGILWKHNGNKVVEFNGNEEHVYKPFKDRITLDWVSAELDIANLRFEDSGEYELEVEINKGLRRSLYKLEVIDEVAKPTISCEMNDGGSSNGSGKLVCSAEPRQPQSLMTFEWRSKEKVQPGPNLTISLGGRHDDEVYSCNVSNPLSSKAATFTAKDCYSDKSSSTAIIASVVCILLIVLLALGITLFCKLRPKVLACFAKDDLEKQPPVTTEGSDKRKAPEKKPLLHRESTLLSTQPLGHLVQVRDMGQEEEIPQKGYVQKIKMLFEPSNCGQTLPENLLKGKNTDEHEEMASPPSPPCSESPSSLDRNNFTSNDKGDVDAEQLGEPGEETVPRCDPSDSEKANEADPAVVPDNLSENGQSDRPGTPEQPEPEKEADEDEVEVEEVSSAAAGDETSAAQPKSPLTENSLNAEPEDANTDQVIGETAGKNLNESDSSVEGERNKLDDSSKDKQLTTVPAAPAGDETSPAAQPGSPLTQCSPNAAPEDTAGEHKEDTNSDQVTGKTAEKNTKESDSSSEGEGDESENSEDKQSTTVPEQNGSETSLHGQDVNQPREEEHTSKDNQQETVKPVSEVENETGNVGDCEEATSQQPQGPPPTKPDDINTSTSQVSPDAADADPVQEEEEKQSYGSDRQLQKCEGNAVEDENEVHCGPKEEKPDNEHLSEDKVGQKKDEVVA
ncbi:nucleolar and coiled-body phosphoprotein 1-like isoform X2 [Plectropomus leopardus]|uniref:nucleolar and coiled-body phosphoprotein 1-like isoform X2 n=1 Tax=Plectropomus leopardus TaxID=160734 RepID=UPI001C4CC57D|nr:nucleolar and coiled-body phosphoprotein 1-like isoform X2 [Plectropomus leopardus]